MLARRRHQAIEPGGSGLHLMMMREVDLLTLHVCIMVDSVFRSQCSAMLRSTSLLTWYPEMAIMTEVMREVTEAMQSNDEVIDKMIDALIAVCSYGGDNEYGIVLEFRRLIYYSCRPPGEADQEVTSGVV